MTRNLLTGFIWAIVASTLLPSFCLAQSFPIYSERGEVASLDRERLFRESLFGKTKIQELESRSRELTKENQSIQALLEEEERVLTELRKTTEADEFEKLAKAFDEKVRNARETQDKKLVEIRTEFESAEREFAAIAAPILRELMSEIGVTFILDQNAIILSLRDGDITDQALEIINEKLRP